MIKQTKYRGFLDIFLLFEKKREKMKKYSSFICVEKKDRILYRLHKKYRHFWQKEEFSKNGKCKIKLPGDSVGRKNNANVIIVNKKRAWIQQKPKKKVNEIYQLSRNEKNIAKMTIFRKTRSFFRPREAGVKGLKYQEIA